MGPTPPRLKILSVGGNAVSAFLSWRLSATNACDVTLVWKNGFDQVAQYGVSFKSTNKALGTERFKPRQVVRSPEEAAATSKASFDYVVLCVKALPDVYDLAAIIESVVAPQHTCILVNTTHSLGIESYLESRFPTNVVLSLVAGAELIQTGATEFEHTGSTDFWVGPANKNPGIPASIQSDMAEALGMTLISGQVDCKVSPNIRQQQYERMIGPIAFQPVSVLFETPNHAELLEKSGVHALVSGVIEELLALATAQGCVFPADFAEETVRTMSLITDSPTLMYQDYTARRPLEIETFLGSPIKLAKEANISVPRIDTLYALLHNVNILNQKRPLQPQHPSATLLGNSPNALQGPFPPRMPSSAGMMSPPNGPVNGPPSGPNPALPLNGPMSNGGGPGPGPNGMAPRSGSQVMTRPGGRSASMGGPPPQHMMRRGMPPSANGYPPRPMNGHMNGQPQRMGPGPPGEFRGPAPNRASPDENLEEFSHLMLYDNGDAQLPDYSGLVDAPDSGAAPGPHGHNQTQGLMQGSAPGPGAIQHQGGPPHPVSGEWALRERELQLRQRELALREREFSMQRPMPPNGNQGVRRGPPPRDYYDNDDDDDGDYFDPMAVGPVAPMVDPDNFDMMSVTSRRTRKVPNAQQLRNGDMGGGLPSGRGRNIFGRQKQQSRASTRIMGDMPGLHQDIMSNPMMGYSSNPYGTVDRHTLGAESRSNSLTAERLNELQQNGGGFPPGRRASQSPGNALISPRPGQGRSPSGGYEGSMGPRSSPPGEMRAPMPRHPSGHGNAVAPQQVEQQAGVSNYPLRKAMPAQERSLTGSASASAGSGDSNRSARIDMETSGHSSSSSLGPLHGRAPVGVRS